VTGVWTQGFTITKQVLYRLNHTSNSFCPGYFWDGVLWTICLGWPQIAILLFSASQITRITGIRCKLTFLADFRSWLCGVSQKSFSELWSIEIMHLVLRHENIYCGLF
jgi:hypothetical protein